MSHRSDVSPVSSSLTLRPRALRQLPHYWLSGVFGEFGFDPLLREQQNQLNRKIRCINKQCSAWGHPGMTQWHSHLDITPQLPPGASSADHCCKALTHWHTHIPNDYLCAFKWIRCDCLSLGSVGGFFSKWQGNFSIDLNCYYKIIRQVLNVSLKASLKSVIAKTDSFGAVKKRESCHSLLLLSQGNWELQRDIYWENLLWTNPIWSLRKSVHD